MSRKKKQRSTLHCTIQHHPSIRHSTILHLSITPHYTILGQDNSLYNKPHFTTLPHNAFQHCAALHHARSVPDTASQHTVYLSTSYSMTHLIQHNVRAVNLIIPHFSTLHHNTFQHYITLHHVWAVYTQHYITSRHHIKPDYVWAVHQVILLHLSTGHDIWESHPTPAGASWLTHR